MASFADIPAFDLKKQEETKTKLLQERLARKEEADARKEEDDEKSDFGRRDGFEKGELSHGFDDRCHTVAEEQIQEKKVAK